MQHVSSRSKLVILFTVFIDILGLGIVIPVLPFYLKSFGASDFTVTLLFSVFSLFSFVSAPFLGSLSDRIGRRPVLIASIASTAIGWLIFASARSIPVLFLGRIIDGMAAGNISTAQSYLIDISEDTRERTVNLGLIGAMFGIGLIIGPVIGGVLGSISHALPFWTVGVLAIINCVLAVYQLPETNRHRDPEKLLELNPLAPIVRAVSDRHLLPGYIAWFLFGIAVAGMQSVFALYLNRVYGYGEFIAGMFLTGMGIILTLNQAVLLRRFWIKRFREPDLELVMMVVFSVSFFALTIVSVPVFIFGVVASTLSQSVLRVVMTSQMAGASGTRHGETVGMMTSVMSLSMIVGPVISGMLFTSHFNWPFLFLAVIAGGAFSVLYVYRRRMAKLQAEQDIQPGLAL